MAAETDALTLTFNSIDDLAHACRGPHVIPWDDPAFHEDFKNDWRNRARHVVSLAAASAVQPAAGREEIARAVYDWVRDDAPVGLKMQMGPEIAAKLIDRLAALSQPGPASEGEV